MDIVYRKTGFKREFVRFLKYKYKYKSSDYGILPKLLKAIELIFTQICRIWMFSQNVCNTFSMLSLPTFHHKLNNFNQLINYMDNYNLVRIKGVTMRQI